MLKEEWVYDPFIIINYFVYVIDELFTTNYIFKNIVINKLKAAKLSKISNILDFLSFSNYSFIFFFSKNHLN